MELLHQYISLKNARFFAYHGYYPEERLIGNEFWVDIETRITLPTPGQHDGTTTELLEATINYEELYAISKSAMLKTRKLLETVAHDILSQVKAAFASVEEISVSISKTSPPFGGDHANASVKLHWKKNKPS